MEATADLLKEGEKAKIAGLKEGQFSLKLAEMGCVPGTEIIRLYESAGGSTIAYRIDKTKARGRMLYLILASCVRPSFWKGKWAGVLPCPPSLAGYAITI